MTYIPYLSTIVTFAFVIAVYTRYRQRGGVHLLLWAVGLLFYGIGTLSEVSLSLTYNIFVLKIWYLTGAMLTAAWLGQGTVHLLIRKGSAARVTTWVLGVVSALALFLVLSAPSLSGNYEIARPASEQYKDFLTRGGLTVFLTILLNIYGTLTLVGGAIYSAFLFWRKRILANRMFGNVLIAAGALSPAVGGSMLKAGLGDMLYLSEFVGAILMYIGFVMATSGRSESPD
ncbi:hypothetical protein [Candidatus Villigracilis saccharophilus]|uniref:hypothetical protein n=1 Tax=Candidatus Villigracilis saccharophilus TaxID=3140684 RepID=UPI0031371A5D|nr:hypothetical protein [Anaerolineales bacterium]